MTGELVFITGSNGHIGFRVLVETLKAGDRIRAAVRSPEKAENILASSSIKALQPGDRLSFVQVPDLEVDGAYDSAIQGTQYAIHVASPIPSKSHNIVNLSEHFIKPAVRGTIGLLNSAHKASSVRRIVITSSVAAIVPSSVVAAGGSDPVFNEKSRVNGVHKHRSDWEAYAASKVAALNEAEKWLAENNPPFDIIHLFPGNVIGRNELVTNTTDALKSSNQEVLGPVTGANDRVTPTSSVHVEDVAEAHVRCLDPKVPGNQGFILSSDGLQGVNWEDSLEITAR
ncbi:hypothetical protein ACMYSQ_011247 [Aspergillus niger]